MRGRALDLVALERNLPARHGWERLWYFGDRLFRARLSASARPKPAGPTYHLLQPGTMRARCGVRMGPSQILTVEAHVVTCQEPECRYGGWSDDVRRLTSVR